MRHIIFIKVMHRIIHQIILYLLTFLFLSIIKYLLKASPNGEYSNLVLSTSPGLFPKSSPVTYSYLSNSLDDNGDIVAASLS